MRDWAKQEYWSIHASTQNSLSYPGVPAERSRKCEYRKLKSWKPQAIPKAGITQNTGDRNLIPPSVTFILAGWRPWRWHTISDNLRDGQLILLALAHNKRLTSYVNTFSHPSGQIYILNYVTVKSRTCDRWNSHSVVYPTIRISAQNLSYRSSAFRLS